MSPAAQQILQLAMRALTGSFTERGQAGRELDMMVRQVFPAHAGMNRFPRKYSSNYLIYRCRNCTLSPRFLVAKSWHKALI